MNSPRAEPTMTTESALFDPPGFGRSLVGMPVVFTAGSDAHRAALEDYAGHWPQVALPREDADAARGRGVYDGRTHGADDAGGACGPVVTVRFDASPLDLPDREPDVAELGFRQWFLDDHTVVVDDHGVTQGWSSGAAVRVSAPGEVRNLERVLGTLLARSLVDRGLKVFHAAGLCAPDGVALLALGTTGAGKSTLVAAGLQAGWQVLADDLVVVRVEAGEVWLAGFPRRLAVPSELAVGLPGEPLVGDPRGRSRLEPSLLTPGWHRARGVVLIGHATQAQSVTESVGARAVLDLAVGSTLVSLNAEVRRATFTTSVALSRLPAVWLGHGQDPARRAAGSIAQLASFAATLGEN